MKLSKLYGFAVYLQDGTFVDRTGTGSLHEGLADSGFLPA